MNVARMAISVLFVIVCVFLTVIVLFQEGKDRPISFLANSTIENSYLKKSKQITKERMLRRITAGLLTAFFILAAVLNTNLI